MNEVAIIIPLWNQIAFTKKCIASLYKNTPHDRFSLILVDNASSDKTPKYLTQLQKIYKNLHVITHQANTGYVGGINAGLSLIDSTEQKPQYILLGNNDIEVNGGWLDGLQAWFTEHPDLGGVGPISNAVLGPQHERHNKQFGNSFHKVNYLIGFWFMVPYDVYKEVGKLDDSFGMGFSDDIDYSIRIRNTGKTLGVARNVHVFHAGSASYNELHKDPEAYKKDIAQKHEILEKKWGKKVVEETMNVKYYDGRIIFPSKEFCSTPFAFSLLRLFKNTEKNLEYYNGKSTMALRCKNDGLKNLTGSFALILDDQAVVSDTILEFLEDETARLDVPVYFICYKGTQKVAVTYIRAEALSQLDGEIEPLFMTTLNNDEDHWFREGLVKAGIKFLWTNDSELVTHTRDYDDHPVFLDIDPDSEGTIGTPCIEVVHNTWVVSMLNFFYNTDLKTTLVMPYNLRVDVARNAIVENRKGKWVWFIDSDQTFHTSVPSTLLSANRDVMTGVVYKKAAPFAPCVYMKNPDVEYGYRPHMFPLQHRHLKVDMCGTGCVIIQDHVFSSIESPWFEYTVKHGEDMNFFEKVKESGYEIWADSGLPIGHTTLYEVGVHDFIETNYPHLKDKIVSTNIG